MTLKSGVTGIQEITYSRRMFSRSAAAAPNEISAVIYPIMYEFTVVRWWQILPETQAPIGFFITIQ